MDYHFFFLVYGLWKKQYAMHIFSFPNFNSISLSSDTQFWQCRFSSFLLLNKSVKQQPLGHFMTSFSFTVLIWSVFLHFYRDFELPKRFGWWAVKFWRHRRRQIGNETTASRRRPNLKIPLACFLERFFLRDFSLYIPSNIKFCSWTLKWWWKMKV